MAEHIQQLRQVRGDGGAVIKATRTVTDDFDSARVESPENIAARVVWFVAGVIIALLAIRFVFILLGASRGNGFVDLIYGLSYPLATPFFGIFDYTSHYGVARFEFSTLVAIAIYALIAWGIARLVTIRRP